MSECVVCVAEQRPASLLAARADWPTTEVAGHTVHKACAYQAEHSLGHDGDYRLDANGAATWISSGNAIPDDALRLMQALGIGLDIDPEATARLRDEQLTATLAAYRDYRAEHGYSAEELAEMRAAFGEGEVVVDVLTGERTQL